MAIKLKCPTCQERVFAEESDRGGSISCPECDGKVPVPSAAGAAPPATAQVLAVRGAAPSKKPVPTAEIATAVPVRASDGGVIDAEIVDAEPVKRAKTATVIPTAPPVASVGKKKPAKTGFRLRGEEGDDREDGGDEGAPANGNAMLFVVLGVGVLLLAGIGVGVWQLTKEDKPAVEVVEGGGNTPKPNNNGGNGGGNPIRNNDAPEGWDTITSGNDFTCRAPKGVTESQLAFRGMIGKAFASKELGGVAVDAVSMPFEPGTKLLDLKVYADEAFNLKNAAVKGRHRAHGRDFTEFKFASAANGGNYNAVWVHVTGDALFLFRFQCPGAKSPEAERKEEYFAANLKVTHDLGTPDPVDPGPGPVVGPNPNPVPPKPVEVKFEEVPTAAEDGFTVEMPGGSKVKGERHTYAVDRKYTLGGKKFEAKDAPYTFTAYYHDLADEKDYDVDKCYKPLMPHANETNGSENATADGRPAQKWKLKNFFGGGSHGLTVQVGFRVYSLLVIKDGVHRDPDPTLDARAKKFIDSLKLTFDPKKAPTEAADPTWVPMARTVGFTATAPRGTEQRDHQRGFRDTEVKGKVYTAEDDQVRCSVSLVQFGPKADPDAVLLDLHGREKVIDGPRNVTHNGLAGEEFSQGGFGGEIRARVRTFKLGANAVAVLKAENRGGQPEREVALKARAFFNSFKLDGGAVGPGPGPVVVGNGEFASGGKVLPFWAAVVLPGKKELLTFGARNPAVAQPGGVLRRYSYPEFKLKATYHLPLPVNRAVADEKTGKLFCTAITNTNWRPTLDQRETLGWTANLLAFDLKKITDGTLGETEEVKPLETILTAVPISGLEVDPNGGYVYVSAAVLPPPKGPARPATGRLYKIDANKMAVQGNPINHTEPLDGLRMSPAGRTLVTSEISLAPPGGVAKQLNLLTVDAIAWKIAKLVAVPAAAKDFTFTDDGGLLALVPDGATTKLFGYAEGGDEAVDVTPKEIPMGGFAYLRATPDGKRAVAVAGAKQNGLVLMSVTGKADKAKFAALTSGNTVATVPTGGSLIVTPDGKFAVFNCGAVVDIEKTAAAAPKPKD